jgi:hypothetical protein
LFSTSSAAAVPTRVGEHAVGGGRRAAAQQVAQDRQARLLSRERLELLDSSTVLAVWLWWNSSSCADADRRPSLFLALLALAASSACTLRVLLAAHRAFATATMLKCLPAWLRAVIAAATFLRSYGISGQQDHVGAAGHARAQCEPARAVPHQLDDDDAVVAGRRGVQPVDRLGADLERGVEAERDVGLRDVVVDRLRQRDDVEPGLLRGAARSSACRRRRRTRGSRGGACDRSRRPQSVMSSTLPPTGILCGLSRLVPRIVPPSVRIPDSEARSSFTVRSRTMPRKPSRKPNTSMPKRWIAARPKPRSAAFRPGQSPPLVRIPTCLGTARKLARSQSLAGTRTDGDAAEVTPGGPTAMIPSVKGSACPVGRR